VSVLARLRHSPWVFPLAALAALLILGISEISYWRARGEMSQLAELSTARTRVQQLLATLTDAETGQRGYLLTGRSEYAEPFRKAIESLPAALAWLKQHYAKRGEHALLTKRLEDMVANQMSELQATMQLYDEGRHEAWREILLTNIAQERMQLIRSTTEKMLEDEAALGERARLDVQDSLLINRLGVSAMTALSLLALFMYLRQTRALADQRRLVHGVVQAERDQLGIEVQRRTAELTELSRHLLTAREDERSHLARELHDELGALLTAAKLDTARIRTRIAALSPEAVERLNHLNETLNSVISLKRRITEDLWPSSLSNLGLVSALEILLREFEQNNEVQVIAVLQPAALKPTSELTVYRLVQEALTNVSKYARANQVRVSLRVVDGQAEVEVADNGIGFDAGGSRRAGHGLLGMRFRVEAEGGSLALQAAPGQGTRIRARLPLLAATATATTTATA
jgi:signal transduction histidine kinase